MGYKLAGFDVIGHNEIDSKVAAVYRANHTPRHSYVASIRDLDTSSMPSDMFTLDILDGSPPCSSFSCQGSGSNDWGKEKRFAEGQVLQRLDDLFFPFISLADSLRPKVVVAENVVGLVQGNARGYVREILRGFGVAGYDCQVFRVNASRAGVPQHRRRVFFVARRSDLGWPKLRIVLDEPSIAFSDIDLTGMPRQYMEKFPITAPSVRRLWERVRPGDSLSKAHPRGAFFADYRISPGLPVPCLRAGGPMVLHHTEPRSLTVAEYMACSTFPTDFTFPADAKPSRCRWFMGMSVPPFLMERIASQIRSQWFPVAEAAHLE